MRWIKVVIQLQKHTRCFYIQFGCMRTILIHVSLNPKFLHPSPQQCSMSILEVYPRKLCFEIETHLTHNFISDTERHISNTTISRICQHNNDHHVHIRVSSFAIWQLMFSHDDNIHPQQCLGTHHFNMSNCRWSLDGKCQIHDGSKYIEWIDVIRIIYHDALKRCLKLRLGRSKLCLNTWYKTQ